MLKILIFSCCALAILAQTTNLGSNTTSQTDIQSTPIKTTADLTTTTDGTGTEEPITTTAPAIETSTLSTTKPETTVSPTTVAPPTTTEAPAGYKDVNISFSDGSKKCLKGTLALKFDIPYVGNGTNKTATVFLPDDVKQLQSICNETEASGKYYQLLVLTWQQGLYNLTLRFEKDGETVALSQLKLMYNVSGKDFPESLDKGILTTELTEAIFNSSLKSYYKCASEQVFTLTNGKVTFKDVSLTLFVDDDHERSESVCALDDTTSDIVPIAVGCALAGLVIIVIIAYLVGRRRSRQKGYQSV